MATRLTIGDSRNGVKKRVPQFRVRSGHHGPDIGFRSGPALGEGLPRSAQRRRTSRSAWMRGRRRTGSRWASCTTSTANGSPTSRRGGRASATEPVPACAESDWGVPNDAGLAHVRAVLSGAAPEGAAEVATYDCGVPGQVRRELQRELADGSYGALFRSFSMIPPGLVWALVARGTSLKGKRPDVLRQCLPGRGP